MESWVPFTHCLYHLASLFKIAETTSWRVNVKLIAHHSMFIAKTRLCSPNKQPAGSTNLPCFALLKLYWAQYVTQLIVRMTLASVTGIAPNYFFLNIFFKSQAAQTQQEPSSFRAYLVCLCLPHLLPMPACLNSVTS